MPNRPRTIPRNTKEFASLRDASLSCVVISRDNNDRPVAKPPAHAWDMLDSDPKAKLLDCGGGLYRVERRPWPLHYELRKATPDARATASRMECE